MACSKLGRKFSVHSRTELCFHVGNFRLTTFFCLGASSFSSGKWWSLKRFSLCIQCPTQCELPAVCEQGKKLFPVGPGKGWKERCRVIPCFLAKHWRQGKTERFSQGQAGPQVLWQPQKESRSFEQESAAFSCASTLCPSGFECILLPSPQQWRGGYKQTREDRRGKLLLRHV